MDSRYCVRSVERANIRVNTKRYIIWVVMSIAPHSSRAHTIINRHPTTQITNLGLKIISKNKTA